MFVIASGAKQSKSFPFYLITHDKMVLIPVDDAGQRGFGQFLKSEPGAQGAEADVFGSLADAQHGHAFAREMGFLAEAFQGIALAVVGGDHAKASWAAVHRVVLDVRRK
jgi:hypothetical protein